VVFSIAICLEFFHEVRVEVNVLQRLQVKNHIRIKTFKSFAFPLFSQMQEAWLPVLERQTYRSIDISQETIPLPRIQFRLILI